jgi:hypothetical protein
LEEYIMRSVFRYFISPLCLLTALTLWGCGGSSSTTPTTAVSGAVFAGPAAGASVTVKTGAGAIVSGPVTTGSDGSFTIAIPTSALSSDLVFETSGGSFPDEATGTSGVAMGALSAHIAGGSLSAGGHVTVDPSSTVIQKLVKGGMTRIAAEAAFGLAFGYTPDCSVKPAFAAMSSASTMTQRLAGLRAAAFSQLAKDLGLPADKQFELVHALADDLSDGVLDGAKSGVAVTTASGTAIPADVAGRFAKAFAAFLTGGLNKSKLTSTPFSTTFLTPSYKVEYVPGTMSATQGKTSFKIRLTNRSDGTPATGKAITLMPKMYMSTMSHAAPVDQVVESGTPGTYDCTVYYLMASGPGMGYWELKVMIGMESACFYPQVAMTMGSTARATLKGVSDTYPGMMGPAKRTYYLFNGGLSGMGDSKTFQLFIAAADDSMMMSYPPVSPGSTLHDATNAAWTVSAMAVEASSDGGSTWTAGLDGGGGHWSVAGLAGLGSGGTILTRITVNGEQKTTDGNAPAGANGYATFTIVPGM